MTKRLKTKRRSAVPGRYLSEAQLKKLLLYVSEKANLARQRGTTRAVVDELIILLLVNTGLRASEVCNLNIADLPPNHGENDIWVRGTQGNVTRVVEITSKMAKCLERFVKLYRKGAKPNEPLLISERGKRFIYMSLYSKVKNIGQKAGIGKLHPHLLRRTYLVRLYNTVRDLRFVQKQAGHASRKTTAMYAEASSDLGEMFIAIDLKDSSAMKSEDDSNGQVKTTKYIFQEAHNLRGMDSLGDSQQIETCEACGKPISAGTGTNIDSGQILCADCLNELRKG